MRLLCAFSRQVIVWEVFFFLLALTSNNVLEGKGEEAALGEGANQEVLLSSSDLSVWVDSAFPRILRYSSSLLDVALEGAPADAANLLEVNGQVFTGPNGADLEAGPDYALSSEFTEDSASYRFQLWNQVGTLSFDLVIRVQSNSVQISLENVVERGDFLLQTLYFPKHALLSVSSSMESTQVTRAEFSRSSWNDRGKGIIRMEEVVKAPVDGFQPDSSPVPSHWTFISTGKAVGLLTNNIPVFPLHSQASGSGEFAERFALWNGVYHYRVMGEKMPLLRCSVEFIGDLNGDSRVDWMDGTAWLRNRLPDLPATYQGAFLYKIRCARLPDDRFPDTLENAPHPTVYTTFDQCLEMIRKVSNLTHGARQIIYLVGWQHGGHDDKFPDLSVVNPYLGGREKLVSLIQEAKKLNALVSLHVNCDAAYRDSPSWDPEIVCRKPDGELQEWQVMHNQLNYHISHYKDVKKGSALKRIDELLDFLPIESSIHYDAIRYTNESWEPYGHVGMTADLVLGIQRMVDHYAAKGISITVESSRANPAFCGRVQGSWQLYTGDLFYPYLLHRKWIGGAKNEEDWVLGRSPQTDFFAGTPAEELTDNYFLGSLMRDYLWRFEMTSVSDDGEKRIVEYGDSCQAEYLYGTKELSVVCEGVTVARNGDRFLPRQDDEIFVYSLEGGSQVWALPGNWRGRVLEMEALTVSGSVPGPKLKVDSGNTLHFEAAPRQPYRLTVR